MAVFHVLGNLCVILIIFFPVRTYSNSDSEALLKLKGAFTNASSLDSWKPGTEPCAQNKHLWAGVICENGRISGIRLGNLDLSGNIDVDALLSLSSIRSIGLMSNLFSGKIPDFRGMSSLKGLYLSGNQFSGEIPSDYFTNMAGLKKIWLSGNEFSGRIPISLLHLPHLIELHLENNQFSGTIPPLSQPTLTSLDLSNNKLEGEIPSTLSIFRDVSFKGNANLCGGNSGKLCDPSAKSFNYSSLLIWILLAFSLSFLAMVVGIHILSKRQESGFSAMGKKKLGNPLSFRSASTIGKKDTGSSRKGSTRGKGVGDLIMINDEKGEFGLADLMKSAAELLGNGAMGCSYKATMSNGLTVVVKRIKEMGKMGKEQFDSEIRRFGRLKHKNVLTPMAYHYRKDEKLLVYEYQPKGSLHRALHGDPGASHAELNWGVRLNIIRGIAQGLGYLHTELCMLDLPHGNLKSSNVLLSADNEPLLVDYGLCCLISGVQASQTLSAYKSPEAILHYEISPKCDAYCLGIIILEILTGKILSQSDGNDKDLVEWVRSEHAQGRGSDVFDSYIDSSKDCLDEMERVLGIGVACTERNPEQRVSVEEAITRIEDVTNQDMVELFVG